MDMPLEERLARIEAHVAHLERLNEQLNEVVLEQSRALAKLQLQVRRLAESAEAREVERIQDTSARPPHSR